MAPWIRLLGLFVVAVLVLPSLGADEKDVKPKEPAAKKKEVAKDDEDTPKKKGKEAGEKEKKEKLTWGAELVGRIEVDGNSQGDFKLHITQKILEQDYGAQQQYAQK